MCLKSNSVAHEHCIVSHDTQSFDVNLALSNDGDSILKQASKIVFIFFFYLEPY